jgi:hypothetical protein
MYSPIPSGLALFLRGETAAERNVGSRSVADDQDLIDVADIGEPAA